MGFDHKKGLGQHFLKNVLMAQKMASHIEELNEGEAIFEIGPGQGALTEHLYKSKSKIILSEMDERLFRDLETRYPRATLLKGDVLRINFEKLLGEKCDWLLCGNFPYNISSQIMFLLLEHRINFNACVGMFQLEVAERLCAQEGTKSRGILSVLLDVFYERNLLFSLEAEDFDPPPKVRSAVIELRRRETPLFDGEFGHLKSAVKIAFNQRRKMLRNSLKNQIKDGIGERDWFNKRPEALGTKEFVDMLNDLEL